MGREMLERVKVLVPKMGVMGQPEEGQPRFAMDFPLTRRRLLGTVYETVVENNPRMVIQLRDTTHKAPTIDRLGMTDGMAGEVRRLCESSSGVIILAGPNGSGRRTTTYAIVEVMDAFTRNIGTIETNVPLRKLANITHQMVGQDPGKSVRDVMAEMFLQDFNVVMLEGIHDSDTMRYCFQQGRSEHLIIMDLAVPDAGTVLGGVMRLGAPEEVAGGLRAVVSQRLVRVLCQKCRRAVETDAETMNQLVAAAGGQEVTVFEEAGCEACGNTGFAGRAGIFEFLPVRGAVKTAIAGGGTIAEVRKSAPGAGYVSLQRSALEKAARGITSLQEINRVLAGK